MNGDDSHHWNGNVVNGKYINMNDHMSLQLSPGWRRLPKEGMNSKQTLGILRLLSMASQLACLGLFPKFVGGWLWTSPCLMDTALTDGKEISK